MGAVFPATMVLPSVAMPWLYRPPPSKPELPLIVQSVSVAMPWLNRPPPKPLLAELPLTVQLVSVAVPPCCTCRRRSRCWRSCR